MLNDGFHKCLAIFCWRIFDHVGPVDRLVNLIVIRDVLAEREFESTGTKKVIGLHHS